ncbi:hypothetical protein FOL47_004598 [Perkinsus chesapeaki]|uniref:Uncharacterized protein n=1 Tax=Perkinsus chesapeaki TaxID=330153 RepID=A0A7J6M2Y4_PERCH|nr:hypothetical protein FOL47_004598 [Perkinsus chesapeaki]
MHIGILFLASIALASPSGKYFYEAPGGVCIQTDWDHSLSTLTSRLSCYGEVFQPARVNIQQDRSGRYFVIPDIRRRQLLVSLRSLGERCDKRVVNHDLLFFTEKNGNISTHFEGAIIELMPGVKQVVCFCMGPVSVHLQLVVKSSSYANS